MEPLSIDRQLTEFGKFIKIPDNDRIIFSGPFGTGKTYFLDAFFKKNSETYIPIFLSPVDYSISSNEDIFELIKFDIIYEVLKLEVDLNKLDLSFMEVISTLQFSNIKKFNFDIISSIVSYVPIIGKGLSDIMEGLKNLNDVVETKKKELSIDEGKTLEDFALHLENKTGSIKEHNLITELIISLIDRIRKSNVLENQEQPEKSTESKIVLIVDDLDRIDPEHIFRILNVFSVHFNETINKFNIDKIILCCDIENIRNIYSHKYGVRTDFNGYVDKFYSRGIFYFDNKKIVVDTISNHLHAIDITADRKYSTGYFPFEILKLIMASLVFSNAISLRSLLRIYQSQIFLHRYSVILNTERINNDRLRIFEILDLLEILLGGRYSTEFTIKRATFIFLPIAELGFDKQVIQTLIAELAMLVGYETNGIQEADRKSILIDEYQIVYKIYADYKKYYASFIELKAPDTKNLVTFNYDKLFTKAMETYFKLKANKGEFF